MNEKEASTVKENIRKYIKYNVDMYYMYVIIQNRDNNQES